MNLFHKKNRKLFFIVVVILCAVSFIAWYLLFPKTVDSRNGVKHQVGKFNETCDCRKCGGPTRVIQCENKPTHKIKYTLFDLFYCDICWEHDGKSYFESLSNFSEDYSDERKKDAWIYAKEVVLQNLKAPTTAKFCPYEEAEISVIGDGKYSVTGTVTAQNSFGAKLTSSFIVTLTLADDGVTDIECTID